MNILQSVVVVISFAVLLVSSIPIPRNPEEAGLFEGDIAGIVSNLKLRRLFFHHINFLFLTET